MQCLHAHPHTHTHHFFPFLLHSQVDRSILGIKRRVDYQCSCGVYNPQLQDNKPMRQRCIRAWPFEKCLAIVRVVYIMHDDTGLDTGRVWDVCLCVCVAVCNQDNKPMRQRCIRVWPYEKCLAIVRVVYIMHDDTGLDTGRVWDECVCCSQWVALQGDRARFEPSLPLARREGYGASVCVWRVRLIFRIWSPLYPWVLLCVSLLCSDGCLGEICAGMLLRICCRP